MAHRWHDIFRDALTRSEVVGVPATVRAYLRREPTRAEMNAARRAVNSFALTEPADVYHIPVNGHRMLLLARSGVQVDAGVTERAATCQIRPSRPRKPDPARLLETIERGVETAATALRQVDMDHIDRAAAAHLADAIREPLDEIQRLSKQLPRRASR